MARLESRKAAAAVLSGILTALAMPGFGIAPLAFIGLVPLLFALDGERRGRRRFTYGLIFGITFFALDQRWILTLYRFSPWVIPGFLLAVVFLALLFGVFGLLVVPAGARRPALWLFLVGPSAFTLAEFVRAQGPLGTGFSMLYTSLYRAPFTIQIASVFGSWSITALIVLVNVAIYVSIRQRNPKYLLVGIASLAILIIPALVPLPAPDRALPVAVVSSTVRQEVKLDARNLSALTERYVGLGQEAIGGDVDLVVFPESILPAFILSDSALLDRFRELAVNGDSRILFGTGVYERPEIRNEVALLSASGDLVGTYSMVRPVPFGETIPGRQIWKALGLGGLMDSFLPLDLTPGTTYDPIGGIGTPICFESTFPTAARRAASLGSEMLAVVTNDAWFVGSSELYSHFSSAVFRAVETRRDLIQAANGGVSGLIDARGRILAETTEEEVTWGTLEARSDRSFYVRCGDWPLVGLLGAIQCVALGGHVLRRRRERAMK